MFGTFEAWNWLPVEQTDHRLSEIVQSYWTNFAKTGNPNGTGLPNWSQQDASGPYIQFQQDGAVQPAAGLRNTQCNVYREWLTTRLQPAH